MKNYRANILFEGTIDVVIEANLEEDARKKLEKNYKKLIYSEVEISGVVKLNDKDIDDILLFAGKIEEISEV